MSEVKQQPLSWPECAQLCKGSERFLEDTLAIRWGPTDHVLRRFQNTLNLPNLRHLEVHNARDDGPMCLAGLLRDLGRPLHSLTIHDRVRLGAPVYVEFQICWETPAQDPPSLTIRREGRLSRDEVAYYAEDLGLRHLLANAQWPSHGN